MSLTPWLQHWISLTQEVSDIILAESVNGIDLIVGDILPPICCKMQIINDTRIVQAKIKELLWENIISN